MESDAQSRINGIPDVFTSSKGRSEIGAVQAVVFDHYFLDDIAQCLLLDDAEPHTVIRVFGSLRDGRRACVYIHGVSLCVIV